MSVWALLPGNISTCVEQICFTSRFPESTEKHLHMRGADTYDPHDEFDEEETSPHAWSRCRHDLVIQLFMRNISTCVEQIAIKELEAKDNKKHLHMRGADTGARYAGSIVRETSPHAWSRSMGLHPWALQVGNISTCVEQIPRLWRSR